MTPPARVATVYIFVAIRVRALPLSIPLRNATAAMPKATFVIVMPMQMTNAPKSESATMEFSRQKSTINATAGQGTIPVTAGATEVTFTMKDENMTIQPIFYDTMATYSLDYTDVVAGALPEGWRTTDGSDVRNYPSSNGSGPRTFTGLTGYQGKALYWRTTSAEYGRLSAYPLNLEPGSYELTFAMAAWKGTPTYQAKILSSSGSTTIKSTATLTAKPNINGNAAGNISSAERITLPFDITTKGKYIIQFKEQGSGMQEFLLAECRLRCLMLTGIHEIGNDFAVEGLFDLNGRRVSNDAKGMLILRSADGKTRKVIRK